MRDNIYIIHNLPKHLDWLISRKTIKTFAVLFHYVPNVLWFVDCFYCSFFCIIFMLCCRRSYLICRNYHHFALNKMCISKVQLQFSFGSSFKKCPSFKDHFYKIFSLKCSFTKDIIHVCKIIHFLQNLDVITKNK